MFWTVATITGIVATGAIWYYTMFIISPLDRPWIPSSERQTIEVTYVNWACDCADFVETKNLEENPISEPEAEDYLFIAPASAEVMVDSSFYASLHYSKNLRLTGRFYVDQGIPTTYERKTPVKPEHAKVFLYDKIEYIVK